MLSTRTVMGKPPLSPGPAESRPRLLMLATQPFHPSNTGARIRNYYLAKELAAHFDVTYLSFSEQIAIDSAFDLDAGRRIDGIRVVPVPLPARYGIRNLILGAVGRKPVTVLNYTARQMAQALEGLLREFDFDFVQMESIHLIAYMPVIRAADSNPIVTIDWHNIESELMHRYAAAERNPARKTYARATAVKIERLERKVLRQFDAHIVVSERDRTKLLRPAPGATIHLAENGADIESFSEEAIEAAHKEWEAESGSRVIDNGVPSNRSRERRRLVFVGSMDYVANQHAVLHFAREVWPDVHSARPNLVLTIVGRNPSKDIRELGWIPGIEVTGTVGDVRPYYREAMAAIVPLRVGGGSRLKIVEAMAAGVPVISTPLGAEGLDVESGTNILLAASSAEFQTAIGRLCEDAAERRRLSQAGRALAIEKYSWSGVGRRLAAMYAQIAKSRTSAGEEFQQPVFSDLATGVTGSLGLRRPDITVPARFGEAS